MSEKVSPYLKFAVKYCQKMGYQPDEKGLYKSEDLWEGILKLYDHENRNRGNNFKKIED